MARWRRDPSSFLATAFDDPLDGLLLPGRHCGRSAADWWAEPRGVCVEGGERGAAAWGAQEESCGST
jgi:hypothetical protein